MNWFTGNFFRVAVMLICIIVFATVNNLIADNIAAGLFVVTLVILLTEKGTRDVTPADKQSRLGHPGLPRRK